MSVFCYKKINPSVRLGELFKNARLEKKRSPQFLSAETHIALKYLEALEDGKFSELPKAKAYRLAYVREYAQALGLNVNHCLRQFIQEEGLEDIDSPSHPREHIKHFPFASISIFIRNIILAGGVLFFAGYLIWQVKGILEPPKLTIFFPAEGYVSSQLNTVIQGETEQESKLSINGQEIVVNGQGRFETKIDLSAGLNTITIAATKKHGKTTVVTRHIVVRPNNKAEQISLK